MICSLPRAPAFERLLAGPLITGCVTLVFIVDTKVCKAETDWRYGGNVGETFATSGVVAPLPVILLGRLIPASTLTMPAASSTPMACTGGPVAATPQPGASFPLTPHWLLAPPENVVRFPSIVSAEGALKGNLSSASSVCTMRRVPLGVTAKAVSAYTGKFGEVHPAAGGLGSAYSLVPFQQTIHVLVVVPLVEYCWIELFCLRVMRAHFQGSTGAAA